MPQKMNESNLALGEMVKKNYSIKNWKTFFFYFFKRIKFSLSKRENKARL